MSSDSLVEQGVPCASRQETLMVPWQAVNQHSLDTVLKLKHTSWPPKKAYILPGFLHIHPVPC